MALTKGDVHVDARLSNLALGYVNQSLVWDQLFPLVPVQQDSGKVSVYGDEIFGFAGEGSEWADGADLNEIDDALSDFSYSCVQHAYAGKVTDTEVRNADAPHRPFDRKTMFLRSRLMLDLEIEVATKATTAANYPAANTVTPTNKWSTFDGTSDPINDILTGIEAVELSCGLPPNVIVISRNVWSKLSQHPDTVTIISPSKARIGKVEDMTAWFSEFGIEKVIIAGAVKHSSKRGQTKVKARVWSKDVVLARVNPSPGTSAEPTYGFTVSSVNSQVDRERGRRVTWLNAIMNWQPVFGVRDSTGDALAGYLIKSAIA